MSKSFIVIEVLFLFFLSLLDNKNFLHFELKFPQNYFHIKTDEMRTRNEDRKEREMDLETSNVKGFDT